MQDDPAFVAAWKGCLATTAVRHLDVEAPQLFRPLYEMELRGAWRGDQVPACLSPHTAPGYNLPAKDLFCALSCSVACMMRSCSALCCVVSGYAPVWTGCRG